MAFGAITHIDQVHPGVNVAEHLAAKKIDDDLPGRSGFDVQFAHGSAGIDDDNGQATPRPVANDFLSKKLAALVMSDHVVDSDLCVFTCRSAVVIQSETTDGACVDHAVDAFIESGLHDVV